MQVESSPQARCRIVQYLYYEYLETTIENLPILCLIAGQATTRQILHECAVAASCKLRNKYWKVTRVYGSVHTPEMLRQKGKFPLI